jgi:hypothetical protein
MSYYVLCLSMYWMQVYIGYKYVLVAKNGGVEKYMSVGEYCMCRLANIIGWKKVSVGEYLLHWLEGMHWLKVCLVMMYKLVRKFVFV